MTETSFIARRNHLGNYKLLADGQSFGTLYVHDGKVTGGFFRDEEVKAAFRRYCMNPNNTVETLHQYLAACRKAYESAHDDWASEAEAERASERAMWNHLESDPEAFDEMVREDMMGLS